MHGEGGLHVVSTLTHVPLEQQMIVGLFVLESPQVSISDQLGEDFLHVNIIEHEDSENSDESAAGILS